MPASRWCPGREQRAVSAGRHPDRQLRSASASIRRSTSDMFLPTTGLCSHGGAVIHKNETFALVWDPNPHRDWAAGYVEQFLRDVADGSGTLDLAVLR